MGRTCYVQKLFLTFGAIFVHNMFSPCSAKIRASDKDLPVCKYVLKNPFVEKQIAYLDVGKEKRFVFLERYKGND